MQNSPTWVPVVAAMIVQTDGQVLLQRRPEGKPHAGLWEFPGGKVESDENQRDALVRELKEELSIDCDAAALQPLTFAESLPDNPIVLFLYKVQVWSGEMMPIDGAEIVWTSITALRDYPMPPLDVQLREHVMAMSQTKN